MMRGTARGNLSECMAFGKLYADIVHPRALGQLLLSDIIITYLEKAFISFRHNAQNDTKLEPQSTTGSMQQNGNRESVAASPISGQQQIKHVTGARALPRPIKPESLTVPKMRCFGSLGASGMDDTWEHQWGGAQATSDSSISGIADKAEARSTNRLRQPTHIEIVRASHGWHYIDMDGPKHKPGWVSNQTDSILIVSVDVSYISGSCDSSGDSGDFGRTIDGGVDIILTLLSSYEHMGMAQISCISGCRCEKTTYDGHITEFRHSIPKEHSILGLSVNQGYSRCLIQLEVLSKSHSLGHKVKLLQVAIKTYINASQYLSIMQH